MNIFVLLLLLALSQGDTPMERPDRDETPAAVQDLPSVVGDVSVIRKPLYELGPNLDDDLAEKTEEAGKLSLIEVPEQQLNARLYTDKEAYHANETVTLHLENFGPTALFLGVDYTLEVYESGAWRALRFDNVFFAMIGLTLAPGDTYEQPLDLAEKLPPGLYRAVKRFNADGTELEATLAAPFLIVE